MLFRPLVDLAHDPTFGFPGTNDGLMNPFILGQSRYDLLQRGLMSRQTLQHPRQRIHAVGHRLEVGKKKMAVAVHCQGDILLRRYRHQRVYVHLGAKHPPAISLCQPFENQGAIHWQGQHSPGMISPHQVGHRRRRYYRVDHLAAAIDEKYLFTAHIQFCPKIQFHGFDQARQ